MDNLFDIKGKVALITGGSRGIGEMIAEGFVKQGVKTYISSRKKEQCDNTALRLSKFGQCISIPADLTQINEIQNLFSTVNGKIDQGIIKNLFTTIRNDEKKIDISFRIPDKVLTGSKYDIDIILNKPLEEVIIAGAIKPHQVNSFFEQEILLEPLSSGGIFKMTRAPSKPGIQIWSGIIAHPEGMITFTKSIDIVNEI